MKVRTLILIGVTLAATAACAEVKDSATTGFTIVNSFTTKASPQEVYREIVRVGEWWNSEHTYSGNAHNLTLDAKAGGCWCEKLPQNGGSVTHMQVVNACPDRFLCCMADSVPCSRWASTDP